MRQNFCCFVDNKASGWNGGGKHLESIWRGAFQVGQEALVPRGCINKCFKNISGWGIFYWVGGLYLWGCSTCGRFSPPNNQREFLSSASEQSGPIFRGRSESTGAGSNQIIRKANENRRIQSACWRPFLNSTVFPPLFPSISYSL